MKVNHISSRWLGGILAVATFLLVRKLRQVKTLCGFFKLLSVGLIVLATGTQRCWYHLALAAVLLVDIFHSRRAVFVLLVLTAIAVAIFVKGRSVWLSTLILLPTGIAAVVIYVLVTSKVDSIGRFLTTLLHW